MKYEKTKKKQRDGFILCETIARAYVVAGGLPVITGRGFDPDKTVRTNCWTPLTAHFKADVEAAVRCAVAGKANEMALREAWRQFLVDEDEEVAVVTEDMAQLVGLLTPLFSERGLHPASYFRSYRQ